MVLKVTKEVAASFLRGGFEADKDWLASAWGDAVRNFSDQRNTPTTQVRFSKVF